MKPDFAHAKKRFNWALISHLLVAVLQVMENITPKSLSILYIYFLGVLWHCNIKVIDASSAKMCSEYVAISTYS